ncbi:peptidyl-prolyl cis-trans isomerase C [Formivibrio citricus]|uniref:peptidylprolyl isomerase n=1 Tax=Formivibrio citricus TaxID=83765 RepID=A0A1I4WHM6_9NEIS|nr:peptidylprolyl isomerase [Formivibrio citricus]SFN12773.1 peptidyl-prolyl cis-trans isomerase C [Formivibrio citricus]
MQKKRIALALSAALLSAFVFAEAGKATTVNGVAIPESKVDFLVKQVVARGQTKDTPELRARVREDLVRNEIVVQEAVKKGLDKTPEVTNQLEMAKAQILFGAYINDYVKNNPIPEADLKKFYEEQVKPQFSGKEYHARHILVASEAEAKAILAELKKGKKFDALAKAKSVDKASGENGGDLGWANPAAFVKEFGDALQSLPKGKVSSAPVKTQFGYHIIKVEDVRQAKGPTFEEVKGEIQQELQNQALQKMLADLRSKAKVE